MSKLSSGQKNLIRLVVKGSGPDGWAPVSAALYPLVESIPGNFVELEKVGDLGKGRARLTQEGHSLVEAMEWL